MKRQEQAEMITNSWESFQANYHSFNDSSGALRPLLGTDLS